MYNSKIPGLQSKKSLFRQRELSGFLFTVLTVLNIVLSNHKESEDEINNFTLNEKLLDQYSSFNIDL